MAFDDELMPAGPQGHLCRDHFQDVVHDVQQINRFGGQRARQPVVQLALQAEQARIVARRLLHHLAEPLAQRDHQRVVALQVALDVGQFLALAEQALGQHVLAGQQALAHAPPEGIFLDRDHAFEHAGAFELDLRIQRDQRLGRDQPVAERQLACAHPLLQHATRHTHQLRGAPHGHPLGHGGSGGRTRSR